MSRPRHELLDGIQAHGFDGVRIARPGAADLDRRRAEPLAFTPRGEGAR